MEVLGDQAGRRGKGKERLKLGKEVREMGGDVRGVERNRGHAEQTRFAVDGRE